MAHRTVFMGCLLLWAVVSVSLTVSARPGPVASGETAKATAAGASKSLGTSLDDHIISGRRFRWVETMLTWDAAQANCKKLGGTLATADTQAISDALVADYKKGISSWWLPSIGAWIGLRSAKGDFESCPWTWTWVANGKTPNVIADFSAFRSGSAVAGSPAGGCAVLKPAEQRWPYGFGEWLGYPCSRSSTLAPSFCEL